MKRRRWLWISLGFVGVLVVAFAIWIVIGIRSLRVVEQAAGNLKPLVFDPKCSEDFACNTWAEFRREHPFPYQAFATKSAADQTVIVLAEPAPALSKSQLESLVRKAFGKDLLSYSNRRWMIGDDGWLEDVVITAHRDVPNTGPSPESALTNERLAILSESLYGTAFGARVENIGASSYAAGALGSAPNLDVSPSEVREWLSNPGITWKEIETGQARSLSVLYKTDSAGPHISSDGLLVLLKLDARQIREARRDPVSLDSLRIPFRLFAVASDCIVGSQWTREGSILLIGRARTQSPEVLPPLRFETFKLLATESASELQQSYERRTLFAGKMLKGKHELRDWAPIYLSASLIDTELGALLNITDQILKSWSEAGSVEYVYFQYPLRPAKDGFVFGASPLTKIINDQNTDKKSETRSVLFNWNTAGSAVITDYGQESLLTTRHTGALPVTYGSETNADEGMKTGGKLLGLEDTAYEYFAKLKDPNLARVVSYTLLYQTLRASAGAPSQPDSEQLNPVAARQEASHRLVTEARAVLDMLASNSLTPMKSSLEGLIDTSAYNSMIENSIRPLYDKIRAERPDLAADTQHLAQMLMDPRADKVALARSLSEVAPLLPGLRERSEALNKRVDKFNELVKRQALLPPAKLAWLKNEGEQIRAEDADLKSYEKRMATLETQAGGLQDVERLGNALHKILFVTRDLDAVREEYEAANASEPQGRIKTPSAVVSWSRSHVSAVGGHNLTARALKIEISDSVSDVDLVEKNGERILLVNPKHQAEVGTNASDIARAVEHRDTKAATDILALMAKPRPARPISVALEVQQPKPVESWGLGRFPTPDSDRELSNALVTQLENTPADVIVSRDAQGYHIAAERNLTPPPGIMCCVMMKDTLSLNRYLKAAKEARGGRAQFIFENEPVGHVEALAHGLAVPKDSASAIEDFATAAGGGDGGGIINDGFQLVSTSGEKPPFSLRVILLGGERDSQAVLRKSRDWRSMRRAEISDAEAQKFVKEHLQNGANMPVGARPAWDSPDSGVPFLVELTFEDRTHSEAQLATRVLAGLDPNHVEAARKIVRQSLDEAQRGNGAVSQSILDGTMRVKAYISAQQSNAGLVRRLDIIVNDDRQRYLITHNELPNACRPGG